MEIRSHTQEQDRLTGTRWAQLMDRGAHWHRGQASVAGQGRARQAAACMTCPGLGMGLLSLSFLALLSSLLHTCLRCSRTCCSARYASPFARSSLISDPVLPSLSQSLSLSS